MDGGNRIGTVSSVDAKTGMVSVVYQDKDGEVTQLLPYATFNDEYKLPQIGAKVIVAHLSNGKEMGVILGTYWNQANPGGGNVGVYHKDLGGGAYLDYGEGVLTIAAERVRIASLDGGETFQDFEVETLLRRLSDIEQRLTVVEGIVGV